MGGPDLFEPDVVAAIVGHMNDDHAEDSLLICRTLGGRPDAASARMVGIDAAGAIFSATGPDGAPAEVRVPWSGPVSERGQVRVEVVAMYRAACEAAGVVPRGEAAPGGH